MPAPAFYVEEEIAEKLAALDNQKRLSLPTAAAFSKAASLECLQHGGVMLSKQ
jgi:hypothetical protein